MCVRCRDEFFETLSTLRAQRAQLKIASAGRRNPQSDFEIGRGQIGLRELGPFDQANAVAFKIFFQARFKEFFCMGETIKIKVIYSNSRIIVRFNQGISWALDPAGESQPPQQAAGKRGFACTQVALQKNA